VTSIAVSAVVAADLIPYALLRCNRLAAVALFSTDCVYMTALILNYLQVKVVVVLNSYVMQSTQ
jgi:hypothetical protein